MNSNINKAPYLREQRKFPFDNIKQLAEQVDQSYIDIAQKVNARTIGIFPVAYQMVTGEKWYVTGGSVKGQQTLRQIYEFSSTGNITHGINFTQVSQFTRCFGSFTDGTNYYGVIYGGSTPIAGQLSFYINATNIVVSAGAGAPAVSSGTIVLEFLSQF